MSPDVRDAWDRLWLDLHSLSSAVGSSKAVNVNATGLRDQTQRLVQLYFREVRPQLVGIGIGEKQLAATDGEMQRLLELSHGRNSKAAYVRALRSLRRERTPVSGLRERLLGETAGFRRSSESLFRGNETGILTTLRAMLPEAAASYEQAQSDLEGDRVSWRGTAVELREVVREVLDHLAPDDAVTKEPGFSREKDRKGPTMRQKASFVFRSRGLSESKRKTPQEALTLVDALTAAFVRSIYERGSGSTHGAPTKQDVEKLKMYVDIALVELLETS